MPDDDLEMDEDLTQEKLLKQLGIEGRCVRDSLLATFLDKMAEQPRQCVRCVCHLLNLLLILNCFVDTNVGTMRRYSGQEPTYPLGEKRACMSLLR